MTRMTTTRTIRTDEVTVADIRRLIDGIHDTCVVEISEHRGDPPTYGTTYTMSIDTEDDLP